MYLEPVNYMKPFKMSGKCYLDKAVATLRNNLEPDELAWFLNHPQFRHFFHMHQDSTHKLMAMWMLLLRTARTNKKMECWFIVNGIPIRYSLREMALISGLNCRLYPSDYQNLGSGAFKARHFGANTGVKYSDVEQKLLKMKSRKAGERLKMAVLYFLCSVIIGQTKTGKFATPVEPFFLRIVEDLEVCRTFPWGRLAFDENMKDISKMMAKFSQEMSAQWVFPSFILPLEILAFEAIPNLRHTYREEVRGADLACPRMCKSKFRPLSLKGIPLHEVYDTLGDTKDIQSILVSTPEEEVFMAEILEDEGGWDDEDDVVVDHWYKCLNMGKRPLLFEGLYNQDIGSRACLLGGAEEVPPSTPAVPLNVAVPRNDAIFEAFDRLNKTLEDGFKEMHQKLNVLDAKLKPVEEWHSKHRENEEWHTKYQDDQEDRRRAAAEEVNEQEDMEQGEGHNNEKENEAEKDKGADETEAAWVEEVRRRDADEDAEKELTMVLHASSSPITSLPSVTEMLFQAVDQLKEQKEEEDREKVEREKEEKEKEKKGKRKAAEKVRSPPVTRQRQKKKKKKKKNVADKGDPEKA